MVTYYFIRQWADADEDHSQSFNRTANSLREAIKMLYDEYGSFAMNGVSILFQSPLLAEKPKQSDLACGMKFINTLSGHELIVTKIAEVSWS